VHIPSPRCSLQVFIAPLAIALAIFIKELYGY